MDNLLSKFSDKEILSLIKKYGSPLYLFDERGFIENFTALRKTFEKVYPNYVPAYSYKTNYTPYICKLVKEMGGFAEVVSDMELYFAKRIGCYSSHIVYNGPCKGKMLEHFLLDGGVSNIDNLGEAERIIVLAKSNPQKKIRVAIRLNFDVNAGYVSRFGIETNSDSLDIVFKRLKQFKNIKICGLHCHISRARNADAWKKRMGVLLSAADKYFIEAPEFIDVGSGMFASMDDSLASQFNMHVPSYEEYAEIVGGTMAKHYANFRSKPKLMSEPGTTVIARYISLITTVNNIKIIKNKCFATVDSSYYNMGEICHWKKLPYRFISKGKGNKIQFDIDVMGYTCLEQDCIYSSFPEQLAVNDIIIFGNVGGYSIVSKPPFIQPNCRMISFAADCTLKEIMREETYEDILKIFSI